MRQLHFDLLRLQAQRHLHVRVRDEGQLPGVQAAGHGRGKA